MQGKQNSQLPTLLIVDDQPENLNVLGGLLESDYLVRIASSGRRALKAAASSPRPDLILLDVMMPDMSGIEVASQLRSNPVSAKIPIVFVTALDRSVSMDLRRFLEEPHVYHVDKPFSREQLLGQLMIALNARQAVAA